MKYGNSSNVRKVNWHIERIVEICTIATMNQQLANFVRHFSFFLFFSIFLIEISLLEQFALNLLIKK